MKHDHSTGRWHEEGTMAWKGLRPRQEPNYRFFQALAVVFIFAAVALVGLAVVFGWV